MASIATPPLIRFFREIVNLILIGVIFKIRFIAIVVSVFVTGVYSLLIYTSTQHFRPIFRFLIIKNFNSKDYLISFSHSILFLILIFTLIIIC